MPHNKIVMCGTCQVGIDMVDYLFSQGIHISHFVSLTPDQAESYSVSGYASFEELATKYSIPVFYPKDYSLADDQDYEFFKDNKFDLLLVGGWQRLIPKQILETLQIGGLGIHGSSEFLPKGRGRSPINWSLIEGRTRFIIHLYLMTPNADDGDVIDYDMFDINKWDDCHTLYCKNSIVSKRLLVKNIPRILDGNFKVAPQLGTPSYYQKRTHGDGLIDWSRTVFELYDLIRAITRPYPGAFSYLGSEKIFFWKAQPFDTRIAYVGADQGEIVEVFSSGEYVVNCNSGLLLIKKSNLQNPVIGNKFVSLT